MKTKNSNSSVDLRFLSKVVLLMFLLLCSYKSVYALEDLEVTGNITEIGTDYLVVQGYTFYVNQNTELRGRNGSSVSFSYFQLNDLVQVKGNSLGNGTYLATRVKIEDGVNNPNEIELTGYVSGKGTNSFSINNTFFYVDQYTVYRGRNGNTFSFEQIEIGQLLEVKAFRQSNGDLKAIRVKTEDEDNQHGNELELKGFIESKTSNSITVAQQQFFVTSSTVILDLNRLLISFNNLNVGDRVEVKAYKQPDNSFLAVRIKLEDMPENEIEITAKIENISGTTTTINGIDFSTDTNTVFLDNNRMPVTIDFLQIGMWVEVKGIKKQDGTYYARRIKIEDFVKNEIEVKGIITELSSSTVAVNGITFTFSSSTLVFDHLNNPIAFSIIQIGQLVEVKGTKTGTATANASRIKLEGSEDIEILGKITALNSNSLELNGLTVFVNTNTFYLNHANQPIVFSDLSVDLFVEIKMVKNPDNTLLALRVKIEDGINFSRVNGFAGTINTTSIQLLKGDYIINSNTVIIDSNYNLISANQLLSGQQVIVWSIIDASSNRIALQIQSKISSTTNVNETPVIAEEFELMQNYPNPFNPSTKISWHSPAGSRQILKVYDVLGNEVATLVDEYREAGSQEVTFDGRGLASGFYIYQLQINNFTSSKKMLMIK